MTKISVYLGLAILLVIAFYAGCIYADNDDTQERLVISMEEYSFVGIHNKEAVFEKGAAVEKKILNSPVVDDLGLKVLLVSDLPNGSIEYSQRGSMKYLMLKNGTAASGYHYIQDYNGMVVCKTGSIYYLLDKSGRELSIVPEEWNREREESLRKEIEEIEKDEGMTEEEKVERIEMLKDIFTIDGYQKVYLKGNKVYGDLGSRTAYIGDL